jgi:hypothetical protein
MSPVYTCIHLTGTRADPSIYKQPTSAHASYENELEQYQCRKAQQQQCCMESQQNYAAASPTRAQLCWLHGIYIQSYEAVLQTALKV